MSGDRLAGKYEVRRLLGTGSMGAVYEGVHLDLGKRLAIKLIRPEFVGSAEAVARFRREARAASAVTSDYIVQIYDFGADEKLGLYMAIEYLEGEDLETRLARDRWLGVRDTATLGWQVASGLAKAHAAGVIHRDLKPANIFLTRREDGALLSKILDFGASKVDVAGVRSSGSVSSHGDTPGEPESGGETAEPTLTAMGTTLGTPQYMSPEQCEGRVALDGRTDIWGLCAVLYEMLAGQPAVDGTGGHISVMERIVAQDVEPLASRAPWVSAKLASLIDAGLTRDRHARIPDAPTLAARLLEVCPEAGYRASHPAPAAQRPSAAPAHFDEREPPTLSDPGPPSLGLGADAPDSTILADLPPASVEDPESADERVQVFVRANDLLLELAQPTKKKVL